MARLVGRQLEPGVRGVVDRFGRGGIRVERERAVSCVSMDGVGRDERPGRLRIRVRRGVWRFQRRLDRGRTGVECQLSAAGVSLDGGERTEGARYVGWWLCRG